MNASLRMWKNRFVRVSNAWNEPNEKGDITPIKAWTVWKVAFVIMLALFIGYLFMIFNNEKLYSQIDVLPYLITTICAVYGIAYFIGLPWARKKDDIVDHQFVTLAFIALSSLIMSMIVSLSISTRFDQPVTQAIFDSVRKEDPSCTRYEDYRRYNIEQKASIFLIRDLQRAKIECIEIRNKTSTLDQQKKLK